MARANKKPTTRKATAKKSATAKMTAKKSTAHKKPVAKKSAKRPLSASRPRKTTAANVSAQVKDTALKMLAGAASGAVQALIPPLEEAASRGAKSAGTDKVAADKPSKPSKRP